MFIILLAATCDHAPGAAPQSTYTNDQLGIYSKVEVGKLKIHCKCIF